MTLVDARSSRIVLVSHCLLNANARARGTAWYAGVHAVIGELAGRGYSIVQLPCPEGQYVGPGREPLDPATFQTEEYAQLCAKLADDVLKDVELYLEQGVKTVAVVGIEGSPSCGVFASSASGNDADAVSGIFMSALRDRLESHGVNFLSISRSQPEDNIQGVVGGLR